MPDSRAFITDEALWCFADFAVHHADTVKARDMPFMRHVLVGFMETYPVEING